MRTDNWLWDDTSLPPEGTHFVGLGDLDKGLILSALQRRTDRPILVLFSSRAEARNAIDNLCFFAGSEAKERVHYLPSLDFDFYRGLLPNPEVLSERNTSLFHALNDPNRRVFVSTLSCLAQKVVPPAEFLRATQVLEINAEINRDQLVHSLIEAGYQRQPNAYDTGVFSVRGGVIDIFCPLYPNPVRLEFFGDFIEEMRFFEPASQRSLESIKLVSIIPIGQSLIPSPEEYERIAPQIKDRLDHLGIPKQNRDELLEKILSRNLTTEMIYLFPYLSGGAASILEYFPKNTVTILDDEERFRTSLQEEEIPRLQKSFELFEKEPMPIAPFDDLFDSEPALKKTFGFEAFGKGKDKEVALASDSVQLTQERENLKHAPTSHPLLDGFAKKFKDWMDQGFRVHLICHTQMNASRVQGLFLPYGISSVIHSESSFPASEGARGTSPLDVIRTSDFSSLHLWQGYVTASRVYPMLKVVLLSEEEIFGHKKRTAKAAVPSKKDAAKMMSTFRDLKVGDFIVHKDHGIGKYLGLKPMNFQGSEGDFVILEYKEGDKLYIPVYRLNVLQKFVGGEGASPALDKLGGDRWAKVKGKAKRAVAELAAELLAIQAKRKMLPAPPFPEPGQDYQEFELEFPFDETPDQQKAIDEANNDLSQPHPMDRLICGDVGYGKTEVAMRAAYRAVLAGKQVAVLVPTTVLAFQHFENFKKRFKNTPTRIEMMSRMRSSAQIKETLAGVNSGQVDIVVGTHRLLSSDIVYKNLGLVIIDEEHRFGVVHKERLKKMSEGVHVLAMTATPIPRTLNMAMMGIKDISIITTPPPDRLSVRTFVCRRSDEVILEAVSNELGRGGQVFIVHNRIETIFKVAEELKRLLPKAKVEVAHGQMEGDELEKKMLAFYQGEAQILLSTSIIESGLDISRANTMIIDQAHYFGLAQLYQLRGRVGRSEKRAYCYLLIPGENLIGEDAKQRLQVIQRYTDLGSGFNIASHDLEIRGAGDLLGKDQSGHLNAIGIDLYFDLLEETLRSLRGEEERIEIEPEINMKINASFPNEYLPDISERVQIYRRLSGCDSEESIAEIETEVRDRFGNLPEEVINLLGLMRIKLYLKKLHVIRMSCGPKKTSLQFAPSTPASPEKMIYLVQKDPDDRYSLTPDGKLVFEVKETHWQAQLNEITRLCQYLAI